MRLNLPKMLFSSALLAFAVGCSPTVEPPASLAKFLPSDNKTLLIVGQDIDADNNYVKGTNHTPAGVTVYTSLKLDGVFARRQGQPEGVQDWNSVKVGYPNSALAVGLYMAGAAGNTQMDQLLNGDATLNANLDTLIDELQSFNRPIFLRIGYEVDGPWNNYDPTKFKAAWKKIVERIRAKKADRIATVWQVVSFCSAGQGFQGKPAEDWYPGNDLVDWTGFSLFMGLAGCPDKVQELVDDLKKKGKPILIAESAPAAYAIADHTFNPSPTELKEPLPIVTSAQIWDGWYKAYFALLEKNKDVIRGVAYINQDWKAYPTWACSAPNPTTGIRPCPSTYWGDTRVEADPIIKANWLSAIAGAQFLSSAAPDLFGKLNDFSAGVVTPVKAPHTSGGLPTPVPGILEAEAYDRGGEGVAYHDNTTGQSKGYADFNVLWRANESVDIGGDGGQGFALSWTEAGEWLEYSLNVTTAGSYNVDLSVASQGAGGTLELLLDGTKVGNTVSVPDTTDWSKYQKVSAGTVSFPSGKHSLRVNFLTNGTGNGGASPGNIDKISIGQGRAPFNGVIAIPGVLQAENYDKGGQGDSYYDTDSGNNGKSYRTDDVDIGGTGGAADEFTLGWTAVNEWLEYTVNIASAGTYDVAFTVARPAAGGKMQLSIDGLLVGDKATIVDTTSWNIFQDVTLSGVNLPVGQHILRLTFTDPGVDNGGTPGNVDKLTFIKK
jgi:Carbohydrate binding module (family 6)/Glycosyl hydrolase family 26